jgi:uncharacterized tellurite resistance protein B-like protein
MPLLAILVTVLILTPLLAGGILYFVFCQSPEKRWKDRVLGLRSLAQKGLQKETVSLRQMGESLQREEKNLSDRAFYACLEKVSVEQLEAYTGIGPGTTSRLRQSGYTTLAKLQHTYINVHGLGDKRLADIHHAVDELTSATWTRFREDSNCPERAELERRLQSLKRRFEEQEFLSRARSQGMEAFLQKLQSVIVIAEQIRFTGYLGLTKRTVVPAGYFEAPLPSLEEHLHAIDTRASQLWKERERKALEAHLPAPVACQVKSAPRAAANSRAPVGQPVVAEETHPRGRSPAPAATPLLRSRPQQEVIQLRVSAPATPAVPNQQAADAIELTIQFAFAVARADGRLAQAEKAVIERHIEKRYRYDQTLFNRANALCAHYEAARINVDACLLRIKEQFSAPHRLALVELAQEIAAASGGLNKREEELLAKVSGVLQVPLPPSPPALKQDVAAKPELPPVAVENSQPAGSVSKRSDPRELLEIDAGTVLTADLIRRNFNRLWERFAPEKMAGMGDDFVAMAQSRRAALRAAACSLIAPFGEELEPKATAAPPRDMRENPDLDQVFGV